MTKIPTQDEFIRSFRKDEHAADRGVISDEYRCSITLEFPVWIITIHAEKDTRKYEADLIEQAYDIAYEGWLIANNLPATHKKAIIALNEANENYETSRRHNTHLRDKAIRYNDERNTLQEVMAGFAEKLFHIVPECFSDLWVRGDDGNHYHPLNYLIHVHDMHPDGGVDLRLDGFVVDIAIPTVEMAKQLALENYRKVREFNHD